MSAMRARRVVVTGFGAVCPLGNGALVAWKRLLAGDSGLVQSPNPLIQKLPSTVCGKIPAGKAEGEFDTARLTAPAQMRDKSLSTVFALAAATEALQRANWLPTAAQASERERTGVAIGSSSVDIENISDTFMNFKKSALHKISPYYLPKILLSMPSAFVSMKFQFKGPNRAVTTACATGIHNVGDSFRLVRHGDADVMLAGGSDGYGTSYSITSSFSKIRALSTHFNRTPKAASRPFNKDRDGFVIGEGAAVLLLEELEHAKARGATIYGEVLGYGVSGDANHVSAPLEDGGGAWRAMKSALRDARIEPKEVGHINCHATSTPLGDIAECRAVQRLFGEHTPNVMLTASKSACGHLLSATGAAESIWTVLACHEGRVPPILNLKPENLDATIAKLKPSIRFVAPVAEQWTSKRRIALKNAFGFGGTNASLVFSNYIP